MRAFQQWLHFSLIPPHLSALPAHVVVWKHPGKSVCAQFLQLTPKWTMKWNRSWEFEKFDGKFTKYAHSVTKRFGPCTVYFYPLYIFNKYTVTNKNILHYITLHYIDNSRKKIFALFHLFGLHLVFGYLAYNCNKFKDFRIFRFSMYISVLCFQSVLFKSSL